MNWSRSSFPRPWSLFRWSSSPCRRLTQGGAGQGGPLGSSAWSLERSLTSDQHCLFCLWTLVLLNPPNADMLITPHTSLCFFLNPLWCVCFGDNPLSAANKRVIDRSGPSVPMQLIWQPPSLSLFVTICVGTRVWCVHSRQCELTVAVFISPDSVSLRLHCRQCLCPL